jgi:hypothetical protein
MFIAALAVLLLPAVASAQLQDICTPVRYLDSGDRVERDIDDINYIWAFCFDAEAGDSVSVDVEIVSGDLTAFVSILEQATEEVVAAQDNLSAQNTPDTLTLTVRTTGTYIIAIGRDGGETGPSTGTYAITFNMGTSGSAAPNVAASGECPADALAIEPGTEVKGTIDNQNYFVVYCFPAQAGDTVSFEATASGGDLDTLLMLTDADLTASYAENDDIESGNTDSALEYEIPASGNYVIAVGRFGLEDGASTGSFVLSFEMEAGAGGLVKEPAPGTSSGGELACDEDPLSVMIAGMWQINSEDLVMTFDFECDGTVEIQLNKETPFIADYSVEPEDNETTYTLTISLSPTDELVMESAVIAESGILALLQGDTPDDESLIFMENTLYEGDE